MAGVWAVVVRVTIFNLSWHLLSHLYCHLASGRMSTPVTAGTAFFPEKTFYIPLTSLGFWKPLHGGTHFPWLATGAPVMVCVPFSWTHPFILLSHWAQVLLLQWEQGCWGFQLWNSLNIPA